MTESISPNHPADQRIAGTDTPTQKIDHSSTWQQGESIGNSSLEAVRSSCESSGGSKAHVSQVLDGGTNGCSQLVMTTARRAPRDKEPQAMVRSKN